MRRPSYYKTFAKIASGIRKQAKKRTRLSNTEGIVVPGTDDIDMCLTDAQKKDLCDITPVLAKKHDMMVVPLPGNEEKHDGCLASCRGFVHISAAGALEACPFAPYSDTNVMDVPQKDALKSDLLHKIRYNHHLLTENHGGCALNENRGWIMTLMRKDPE